MDDAALDAAIAKASDELGLQVWYREIVRPLVRMEPERWPQCCGGNCEPCNQLLVSVARRAREYPRGDVRTYTWALFVVVLACSRPSGATGDAGEDATSVLSSASAPASSPPPSPPPPKHPDVSVASFSPFEARRARIKSLDEDHRLAANAEVVKAHFGGTLPARLVVQTAELPASRRHVLLVTDDTKSAALALPFAIAVGVDDKPVWIKERPAAGITPPLGPIAIAPGPERRIALAVCDPPTSAVAIRLWDEDGSPFADFAVMDVDGCDALSLLYWPKHGWIVVAVKPGVTRAQLLGERGALAWQRGIDIAARPRVATGVSLASDSDGTFVVVERVPAERAGAADRVLAFRYDERASPLFAAPVDLGETKLAAGERIALARPRAGVVRATLGAGVDVELGANGEILK